MNVPMHRFKYTQVTKEQIDQKLIPTAAGPACASEYSDTLAGKSLKIVTDNSGPVLNYTFKDKRSLKVAEGSGSPVECGCGALTLKQVVLFSHMMPQTQKGYNIVVDLRTNLATVFEVWFNGGKDGFGQALDTRLPFYLQSLPVDRARQRYTPPICSPLWSGDDRKAGWTGARGPARSWPGAAWRGSGAGR
jgi:hypothetical protein